MLYRKTIDTMAGPMVCIASAEGLCALEYPLAGRQKMLSVRLEKWFGGAVIEDRAVRFHGEVEAWLRNYFAGSFPAHGDLGLDVRGSVFEKSVWRLLLSIPPSATTTYRELAKALNFECGARAVGGAVARNPASIVIPCHRVIGVNGSVTGYGGGTELKRWLLDHEASSARCSGVN